MNAAIPALWPHDDPLFDLNPPPCAVPAHPGGRTCPVEGLESIIEELQMLAMAASARRDARLVPGRHSWRTIAEDADVRVVVPA